MHRVSLPYFVIAVLLGVLALLNVVWFRHYAISTAIAIVLYVIVLVVAFFGGRSARHPALLGAAIGTLFGIVAGLGSFLIRDTLQDINVPAHTANRLRLLAWANSPGGHIAAVITAMVAFGILSLIVAILGRFSVKGQKQSGAA